MNEAAIKAEIARLSGQYFPTQTARRSHEDTGAIDRHKSAGPSTSILTSRQSRNHTYVIPNYDPPSRAVLPRFPQATTNNSKSSTKPMASYPSSVVPRTVAPHGSREVLIDGIAFRSSDRSLVRKDLPQHKPRPPPSVSYPWPHTRGAHRPYKSKASRAIRSRNLTLNNTVGKRYPSRRKLRKQINKQCGRFATTGICPNGLTCPYQHDASKIGICWPFLQGSCPNDAATCLLSHDPTPERTPLCMHFANNGRCKNGDACLFPHVHVGQRYGVCRDFAVLGYCEKGLDCDRQHIRECPDFAENGKCPNPKCRLPHVIRANRERKEAHAALKLSSVVPVALEPPSATVSVLKPLQPRDSELGEEFISLTFHETDEGSEDGEDEEDSEAADSEDDSDETSEEENNEEKELTIEA